MNKPCTRCEDLRQVFSEGLGEDGLHEAVNQGVDDVLNLPYSQEAANLPIEQDQMWVNFEGLSPNSKYEAAVRARPSARSHYKGVWSDWSKPVLWRTHPDQKGKSGTLTSRGKQALRANKVEWPKQGEKLKENE